MLGRRFQRGNIRVSSEEDAVIVETSDTSECFHDDSGAQLVIGERIADAMVELLAR